MTPLRSVGCDLCLCGALLPRCTLAREESRFSARNGHTRSRCRNTGMRAPALTSNEDCAFQCILSLSEGLNPASLGLAVSDHPSQQRMS